ncbi:MAG: PIG-L family deacetylase [Rhodanobacter sp.]|nr:MAG: PIG-L family deacetylase [Rhodanobacter sp.]TAL97334.1 MAG: PIG-L family deacetylase [Rhodanobacter sp.]TAM42505.1 MAG: PIG-L family deacetylase [Rhodanobacter sp.]TAN26163.1 MAG: PIG-L family deacetylase [Rhodanobacter sp.]
MTRGAPLGLPVLCAQTRLLVVAPHPDDETIATGLLVQQVREAGGEVCIVLLTPGDNNPWPQRWLERRLRIDAPDRRRWAQRRGIEMQQALERLGLAQTSLRPLGWPDLGVSPLLLHSTGSAVAAIAQELDRFAPNLIVVPSLLDRHPDHGAAHVVVRLALAGHAASPALFTYLIHGMPGHRGFVEIQATPAQVTNKREALLAHRSQLALSGRRLHRLADRPERYVEIGQPSLAADVLPWQPPRWLQPWLGLSVVNPTGAYRWAWPNAPLQRMPDGRFRLSSSACDQSAPCFAHLSLNLPSPWIFDHWGWCELQASHTPVDPVAA